MERNTALAYVMTGIAATVLIADTAGLERLIDVSTTDNLSLS